MSTFNFFLRHSEIIVDTNTKFLLFFAHDYKYDPHTKRASFVMITSQGAGVLNTIINKLPFELHLPGYSYCGPGTRLAKRLARGDKPINKLDSHCRDHDIAYSKTKDLEQRHQADRILENRAWERVKANDSSFGEKSAAWLVTNAMKIKRKVGGGKKKSFRTCVVNQLKKELKSGGDFNKRKTLGKILKAARLSIKKAGGRRKITLPRVIPVPKVGGILPLIPIFAGLSALGALTGGAASVARAVKDAQSAKDRLAESKRHNKTIEAIALGKKGNGLYLKKYKSGYGLYLRKMPKNSQ
jgi:hypothetical protein